MPKGGRTRQYFLENAQQIADVEADIYVVAFGTNDIRYRKPDICAMTPDAYVSNCLSFVKKIREKNPYAQFVFIAPWYSDIDDSLCVPTNEEKNQMFKEYSVALQSFCNANNHIYVNPNPFIRKQLNSLHVDMPWLVDDIHPNGTTGVLLYSKAVLESAQ